MEAKRRIAELKADSCAIDTPHAMIRLSASNRPRLLAGFLVLPAHLCDESLVVVIHFVVIGQVL